jgi:stage III sporulation protein AA
MDLSFLPKKIFSAILQCDVSSLLEIRLRCDFRVKVNLSGKYFYLTNDGPSLLSNCAIVCSKDDIDAIILNVTEHSIYAFNDRIKNGYITTKDGIRIGIAGQCVVDGDKIVTIKNFSSLNIRIPNEQLGCADKLYKYVYDERFYNTLIISPPLYGKTTLLKDLIRKIDKLDFISALVIDERGEFSNVKGENIDIISYSSKTYAFNCGIRALSPNIVITDELHEREDWQCAQQASLSGIKILASCHGKNLEDVTKKQFYIDGIFERFIVLKSTGQAGVIDNVYDGRLVNL